MWRQALFLFALGGLVFLLSANPELPRSAHPEKKYRPGDWFWRQRAYPLGTIDPALRAASLEQARRLRTEAAGPATAAWTTRGPCNIGGRVTTLAISQQNGDILYAGAADGGVLKTVNQGYNWTPLFDTQPSLSMGAIALDPTNDNIVYVGTGEANSSGDSYDGFGMVKSTDGGASWFPIGLENTLHIGKIVIDPTNTSVIYVAAMGALFTTNPERGVYKSTDGGATWSHVLHINDSTGVVDIAINPQNPSVLLAAAWQRKRGPEGRRYVGGIHTGLYRTTDAGATWTLLETGLPPQAPDLGRPAVAIAPSDPSIAYAAFANDPGYFLGFYRSTDGGITWAQANDAALGGLYSNFGWYFGKVFVNPRNADDAVVCGVEYARTRNGGASWSTSVAVHVDHHAMAFHPTDSTVIYMGTDGGVAVSGNGGSNWWNDTSGDLFITQFYAGGIDFLQPALSIGGTQDNGTPRTVTGAVNDWYSINGGDGFYASIDYTNSNYQYAESQYGAIRRTTDNWATTQGATTGISSVERRNWSTPVVMDPVNPLVLYTGTSRLYRTANRAGLWTAISPDLTNGPVPGFSAYATITTIDVAKTDPATIMAGTDDANIWVTTNTGGNWTKISTGLPDRWVTRVRFDPTDRNSAYATFSGYRSDSKLPHIFRTTDLGTSWLDISGNLPESPINVVLVDPLHPERLYIGTDVGCYFTTNRGVLWQPMGEGLPNVSINDMQMHATGRFIRAFTHGRSVWEINADQLITGVAPDAQTPRAVHLNRNFPNPFNPSTTIRFSLDRTSEVLLAVYDGAGRLVRQLVRGEIAAGEHTVTWNGRTERGADAASGVYFYRLNAGGTLVSRKMLLLR